MSHEQTNKYIYTMSMIIICISVPISIFPADKLVNK